MLANSNLSRRRLLKYSVSSLLLSSVWPGNLFADDVATEAFSFIEINDMHLTDEKCGPYFQKLVEQVNATKTPVDFVILDGDLVENGTIEQFKLHKDIFSKIKWPLHVTIGNHDYVSKTSRKTFEETWADSLNYHFEHKGWQFVGLDTSEGDGFDTTAQKPTLNWLDENVPKLSKDKPIILFTHFPLGIAVKYRVHNADDILARFKEHNLQAVLNGHYHGFTERQMGKTIFTTNKCCSFRKNNHDKTPEKGYFVCSVKDNKMSREFVEFKFTA